MAAYYNEFDPFAAAWLKELIKDGLIADGVVDERSIADVQPEDLTGFSQCHFFAGIGGWSLAARLAGWSDDRPMWSGSPPCQPFSTAGSRKGQNDKRHLWPVFFNLIRECAPPVVFGEQVASAIRTGWFDDLQTDMEAEGYATGMVVLPACSVGASHKRDRLWYFAGRMADTNSPQREGEWLSSRAYKENTSFGSGSALNSSLGNSKHDGQHGAQIGRSTTQASNNDTQGKDVSSQFKGASRPEVARDLRFWEDSAEIHCRDGNYRPIPVEPALFPLANGVSNRLGLLRGAGNAIVPQVAAEVIDAYMNVEDCND